jgi:hypothetical protein
MSASFDRLASVTASTKRNPAAASGKVAVPATNLTDQKITPLMPVSKEIEERYMIKSPRKAFVTYISGAPDIVESDVLVVSSVEHKVIAAQPWPTDNDYLELIVEKVKGA